MRTKLFAFSIRRILRAKLKVTLIGSPSGTATTTNVTATMKYCKICPAVSSDTHEVGSSGFTPKAKPMAARTIDVRTPIPSHLNQPPFSTLSGISLSLPINSKASYTIGIHTLDNAITAPIITAPTNPNCPREYCGASGEALKKISLINSTAKVSTANTIPTTPINLAKESN